MQSHIKVFAILVTILAVLALVLITPLVSYSSRPIPSDTYYLKNGLIFFEDTVIMRDDGSFRTDYPSKHFGRDNNRVFYKKSVIKGADAKSFDAFSDYIAADKNKVYLVDKRTIRGFRVLQIRDLKAISKRYFRDEYSNVYFFYVAEPYNGNRTNARLEKVHGISSDAFAVVVESSDDIYEPCITTIASHGNSIYVNQTFVPDLEANQLKIVGSGVFGPYIADSEDTFYVHCSEVSRVNQADPASLKHLTNIIFHDKDNFFIYENKKEVMYQDEKVNPQSLKIIGDKTWGLYEDSLYYLANGSFNQFQGVQQDNLQLLSDYCKSGIGCIHIIADSDRYFFQDREYQKTDPKAMERLSLTPLLVDGIYNGDVFLLKHVDRQTFTQMTGYYAKDKNHVYWEDRIVEDAEPSTFVVLSETPLNQGYGFYARDVENVFFKGQMIPDADADSFEFVPGRFSTEAPTSSIRMYWRDRNNCYLNGEKVRSTSP